MKEFTFDSAHRLPDYKGPCHNVHGHTYKLQVGLRGEVDYTTGMVIDFAIIKKIIKSEVVDKLDHVMLNDVTDVDFPHYMPTAELMVLWIRDRLMVALSAHVKVTEVRLWETPTSYAEWRTWL
ncbi:MAG: 6-carboxytetrahydropterin synthase QueD [Bacteroidota bacterium]